MHKKPKPEADQLWQRISKRNLEETVVLKVIEVKNDRVYLEAMNPQFKQKLFPELSLTSFLHGYIFLREDKDE